MIAATLERQQVVLDGETDIIIRRDFRAPPAKVWRAMTEPALIRQWMWAFDWPMTDCEIDLRPGGMFRYGYTKEGPEGGSFHFEGPILTVEPPHLLRHRELFNGDPAMSSDVETRLDANGTGTRMTMTLRYASAEVRAAAVATGITDGMEETYGKLDALLGALPVQEVAGNRR
jgi:uncharacterized protein YndB with AHSA1/START domain